MLDLVVIGGQKCGSTSLDAALRKMSDIDLVPKEFGALRWKDSDEDVLAAYRRALPIGERRSTGEVCTTYAMRGDLPSVAQRAHRLHRDAKLVYVVRNPLDRILSHHHHDSVEGRMATDIGRAIRDDSRLVDFTRYAWQLQPWTDVYGTDALLILRLEDLIRSPAAALGSVRTHLGLDLDAGEPMTMVAENRSDGKPVLGPALSRLLSSRLYTRGVKPLLPRSIRTRATAVLPKAPAREPDIQRDVGLRVLEELRSDLADLAGLMGVAEVWSDEELHRPIRTDSP